MTVCIMGRVFAETVEEAKEKVFDSIKDKGIKGTLRLPLMLWREQEKANNMVWWEYVARVDEIEEVVL